MILRSLRALRRITVGERLGGAGTGADGGRARRRRQDEPDAVAGIEEGRIDGIAGNARVPLVGGLAGDRAGEAAAAVEADLAEALAAVRAAAHAAGVRIEHSVGGTNHGAVIHLVRKAEPRPDLVFVQLHRGVATAAVHAVARKLQPPKMPPATGLARFGLKKVIRSSTSVKGVQMSQRKPILTVRFGVT